MAVLKDGAIFYIKSSAAQSDGSIVIEVVCPDPGEGMEGLFVITLTAAEVQALPGQDAAPSKLAQLVLNRKTFGDALTILIQAKLDALALTLRPPADVAQAVLDILGGYDPIIEIEPAKPVVVKREIDGVLTDVDAIQAATYTGGNYIGKGFTV